MSAIGPQITGVSIVCSTVCWGGDQRKHQSPVSLAFVKGIHRWPIDGISKLASEKAEPLWWAVETWSQSLLNIIFQAGQLIFLMSHYFLSFSLWNMFGDPLTINPTGPTGPLHICKQNHWTMWTKRNSFSWDLNVVMARWLRSMWNTRLAWSYVSNTLGHLLGSSLHSTCLSELIRWLVLKHDNVQSDCHRAWYW